LSAGGDGGSGLLEHQEPCRDGKVKAPQRASVLRLKKDGEPLGVRQ